MRAYWNAMRCTAMQWEMKQQPNKLKNFYMFTKMLRYLYTYILYVYLQPVKWQTRRNCRMHWFEQYYCRFQLVSCANQANSNYTQWAKACSPEFTQKYTRNEIGWLAVCERFGSSLLYARILCIFIIACLLVKFVLTKIYIGVEHWRYEGN